jgi:uncharacterized membrane protein
VTAAVAVGAGLAATLLVSYAIDVFASTQSSMVQTGILVAVAAGVAFFVSSPAIAAGVATGLLVVPLSKAVYNAVPSLANPTPMGGSTVPSAAPAAATATTSVSALHMRALHRGSHNAGLRGYGKTTGHKQLRAMHVPSGSIQALHLRGVTMNRGAGGNPILARTFGR